MPFLSGRARAARALCLLAPLLLLPACRKGGSTTAATTFPLQNQGNSGCLFAGPELAAPQVETLFGPGGGVGRVDGPLADPGTSIRFAALGGAAADGRSRRIFLACADPSIRVIDLDLGAITTLTDEAAFAAFDPAIQELGAVAILDADTLLVAEHSRNTVLAVDRGSGALSLFAGVPSPTGGFADGPALVGALFSFAGVGGLAVDGNRRVLVADSGNHRIRSIQGGTVSTLAGSGVPGYLDGTGARAQLLEPSGLAVGCDGTLLFTERGQRVRQVRLVAGRGGVTGTVTTRVGNGIGASVDGTGAPNGSASVHDPLAPMTLTTGDLVWFDRASGRLRWLLALLNTVASPLPAFSADGVAAMVVAGDDSLVIFDAVARAIVRVR
jgi:serine/threonine-protein kinase